MSKRSEFNNGEWKEIRFKGTPQIHKRIEFLKRQMGCRSNADLIRTLIHNEWTKMKTRKDYW